MNKISTWLTTSLLFCGLGCGGNEQKAESTTTKTAEGTSQANKPADKPADKLVANSAQKTTKTTSYSKIVNFNEVASTMPNSTEIMFAFPGVESFLNIVQTAWSNTSDAGLLLGDVISPLKDGDPKALGFDTSAPIVVAVSNTQKSPEILLRLAANNEQKAVQTINQILTELRLRSNSQNLNGITVSSVERSMAFAAQGGALWISLADRNAAQVMATSLKNIKEDSLAKNQNFQQAIKGLSDDNTYITYTSASLLKQLAEPLKSDPDAAIFAAALSGTSGIIQAVKMHDAGLDIHLKAILEDGNILTKFKKTNAKDKLLSQLPTAPLLVVKSNIDLQSVWDFFTQSDEMGIQSSQAVAMLEQEFAGLHKKILSTYEGPLTISVHEATKDDALPVVPVLYFKGKDGKVLNETVEFVCNKLETPVKTGPDGSKWCPLNREPVMFGAWKEHFIVTSNSLDVGFGAELGKKMAKPSTGLVNALETSSMFGFAIDIETSIASAAKNRQILQEMEGFPGAVVLAGLQYIAQDVLPTSFGTHLDLNNNSLDIITKIEGSSSTILAAPLIGSIGAAIAIPNFISMQYKSKRAEVPTNIKAIKTAQIMYESAYDVFVNVDEYPPRSWNGKEARPWIVSQSGGFEVLNWMPDGDVRGSYSVTTTSGGMGSDFTIVGVIDADGDGIYATYTATKSTNPNSPTTAPDIY